MGQPLTAKNQFFRDTFDTLFDVVITEVKMGSSVDSIIKYLEVNSTFFYKELSVEQKLILDQTRCANMGKDEDLIGIAKRLAGYKF
jgi:hypothetical protein